VIVLSLSSVERCQFEVGDNLKWEKPEARGQRPEAEARGQKPEAKTRRGADRVDWCTAAASGRFPRGQDLVANDCSCNLLRRARIGFV
jgi:hypothetical protein